MSFETTTSIDATSATVTVTTTTTGHNNIEEATVATYDHLTALRDGQGYGYPVQLTSSFEGGVYTETNRMLIQGTGSVLNDLIGIRDFN